MRRVTALVGEVLLTCGLVILLFTAYQLVWTNVAAARASRSALAELDRSWAAPDPAAPGTKPSARATPSASGTPGAPPTSGTSDEGPTPAEPVGTVEARIRIPRLGADWVEPVIEGTNADELARGIGHYVGTAGPGAIGNFALAGHRATHGEPWRDLDRMQTGDQVVVETRTTVYTYVVTAPWRLVRPDQREVIDPVPGQPSAEPVERLITLTTCNPRWASTERLVVPGRLQSRAPRVAT